MSKVSDPYERQHIANLAKYGKLIDEIFKTATQEAAQIGALVGASGFDASRVFSFSDYPLTQKRIKSLLARLANNVEVAIVNGIETEWTLANNKNSALSRRVFGENVGRLTQAQYRRYFSTNDDARQAFLQRKEQGLNLSERVWRYAQGFKNDIELGLDVGIRNGLDADAMSRELRQYLKYPDKLFRRVRDEHGNLVLSKRAADFHPGQGVYRSSYKNARRLAATEINMAYRTADYERMQQLDFVVGIEVCLSNNHPIQDICDDLCGRYPKAFKFTGWHPHCRCYVVSILKTEAELMAENRAILAGEEPSDDSVNRVDDVPRGFKEWVMDNSARIARAQSIPYFMQDNMSVIADIFTANQSTTKMADQMSNTLLHYFSMQNRDPRLAVLGQKINNEWDTMTDIERATIQNQFRKAAAECTFVELQQWEVIDSEMTFARIDNEYVVHRGCSLVSHGKQVKIPEVKRDMIVLKDKYGKEFAYPIGVRQDNVLIKATDASEVLRGFPDFLRKPIERVSFYPMECPADSYWRIEYQNNKHRSAATDGGYTSFWECTKGMSQDEFKIYMSHEAGHALDSRSRLHSISGSQEWANAINADIDLASEGRGKVQFFPTAYAATNHSEDFAESIMLFITDRQKLKEIAPNREQFLHELTKKLNSRRRL